jgi:hypothetical protein
VRTLFVDASYFVAIFNEDDEWHAPALRLGDEFARASDVRFVTTLAVLGEFLTSMSRRHDAMKTEAVAFVRRVLDRPQFEIVTVDRSLFDSAVELFSRRLDKEYSMVDCISMVICQQRSITEVLTADRDFQQERLRALLRE